MKNLFIIIVLTIIFGSSLHSESYHFVANDPYYKVPIKIDSINVYYMNTGKDTTIVSSSVHLGTITTVELNEEYNDVRLYPNPANDLLNIEFTSNNIASSLISVVDIEGRKLYSENKYLGIGKQNLNLNIAGLNQEFYFITIGKSTHKFIKIGSSNGSDISLTQITSPSLTKDNSVQSQYDYKFTIYAKGFKPYEHLTARTKDRETIIFDMLSQNTVFDGKHIRVELFLNNLKVTKHGIHHNNADTYYTTYSDYIHNFTDTVVIRDSLCYINRKSIPRNSYFTDTDYDIQGLKFTIGNDSLIREFKYSSNFKCSYSYEYSMEYEEKNLNINLNVNLDIRKSNKFKISDFKDVQISLSSKNSTSQNHGGSSYYTDIYGPYNASGSYIIIEFID